MRKEKKCIKARQFRVVRGESGTGPVPEGGSLPSTQPHVLLEIVSDESDEIDVIVEFSLEDAKALKERL